MSISHVAMIVFFGVFGLASFWMGIPAVAGILGVSALVAAVALIFNK